MATTRAQRVRTALVTLTLSGAATGFLGACGTGADSEARTVYCVDDQDRVVDPDDCEEDRARGGGGAFFFLVGGFGGNSYRTGDRIPGQYTSGAGAASRIDPGNAAARASAGLPRTGSVASGTRLGGGIGSGNGSSGS